MGKKWLIKTDKNGTEHWGNDTCQRCGGQGGSRHWFVDGGVCYECGGSGISKVRISKKYTPEYQAKLDARAKAKQDKKDDLRRQEAEAVNKAFLQKHFDGKSEIFIIKGNTYDIKDTLKAEGCKFNVATGWYATETTRDAWVMAVDKLIYLDIYNELQWNWSKIRLELKTLFGK